MTEQYHVLNTHFHMGSKNFSREILLICAGNFPYWKHTCGNLLVIFRILGLWPQKIDFHVCLESFAYYFWVIRSNSRVPGKLIMHLTCKDFLITVRVFLVRDRYFSLYF